MVKYFDDVHASWQSQLAGIAAEIDDSADVRTARKSVDTAEGLAALGDALSKQLRYREAAETYSDALRLKPDNLSLLRRRAGRYISTLQCAKALEDLERCMVMGGDRLDILYRIGLCRYLMHQYASAYEAFLACFELCDDEMGIAVMYWHTLCSYKLEHAAVLLEKYHSGMAVGHHTAYEKAVSVFAGAHSFDDTYREALNENNDLESVITLYGLCIYASYSEESGCARRIMEQILQRDGFWPAYAYLAAWNDSFNFAE